MRTNLTLLFILLILASCGRDKDDCPTISEEGTEVTLAFINDYSPIGRAFGDNVATDAEKKVNTARIYVFRPDGSRIFEKELTSTEITGIGTNPVTFVIPGMLPNTAYNYYVIINRVTSSINTLSNLTSLTESDVASYNGPWANVKDDVGTPVRSGGFVMNGNASATTTGDVTQAQDPVSVIVKRVVAKLDIQANIDQTLFGTGKKYPGTLTIDSAIISRTQANTPLILATPTTTVGTLALAKQLSNSQTANQVYQNRFYIFENGAIAANSRVLLTLYGTYAYDGQSSYVTYSTEITGNGGASPNGAISRNGAYYVTVNIKGLTGTSISVSITVSNWETIVNQSTNLGS